MKNKLDKPRLVTTELPFIPDYSEDLGYVLGAILGDGNLCESEHYAISFRVKDKDFADEFAQSLGRILKRDFQIRKAGALYKVRCFRKQFFKWIKQCNLFHVLIEHKQMAKGFLRGFFDAEGCISYDKSHKCWELRICNTAKNLIESCSKLLGIHFEIRPYGRGYYKVTRSYTRASYSHGCILYRIAFNSRLSITLFRDQIGTAIMRKRRRLNLVPEPHHIPPKEELEKLYYEDKLSQREIGDKFGVSQPAVWKWFRRIQCNRVVEFIHGDWTPQGYEYWLFKWRCL